MWSTRWSHPSKWFGQYGKAIIFLEIVRLNIINYNFSSYQSFENENINLEKEDFFKIIDNTNLINKLLINIVM